jgi:hypothetical protein
MPGPGPITSVWSSHFPSPNADPLDFESHAFDRRTPSYALRRLSIVASHRFMLDRFGTFGSTCQYLLSGLKESMKALRMSR